MQANLRKRDQLTRCLFQGKLLRITNFHVIMAAKQKFWLSILQFPIKTARINEISTVPSDSTQKKSPIPATTPLSELHPRASVSDQSQTSDAHVNRVQAQGQGGDRSKHKFVYLKQWEKKYPWVNPLENVSLIVCFAETTSIKRYQTEVVFQFACQYGPTKDSTLDNIHQLIKSKFGQNRNISKTTAKAWCYQRYNDNDDMFTKSDIYTSVQNLFVHVEFYSTSLP